MAETSLNLVKRGGYEILTAQDFNLIIDPETRSFKEQWPQQFFNISPHTYKTIWLPIIHEELRKTSGFPLSSGGEDVPHWQQPMRPKTIARMRVPDGLLEQLGCKLPGVLSPLLVRGSGKKTWSDTESGEELPGCSHRQLSDFLIMIVKRESDKIRKDPRLQSKATINLVAHKFKTKKPDQDL